MDDMTVTVLLNESILMSKEYINILEEEFLETSKSYVKIIKDNLKVLKKVQYAWCNAHSDANIKVNIKDLYITTQKFRNKKLKYDLLDVCEKLKEWEIEVSLYQLPSELLNSIPLWIILKNPRDKKYKINYDIVNKYL